MKINNELNKTYAMSSSRQMLDVMYLITAGFCWIILMLGIIGGILFLNLNRNYFFLIPPSIAILFSAHLFIWMLWYEKKYIPPHPKDVKF